MDKKKTLSLVIPCYNEEENVNLFYQECVKTFNKSDVNLELVFVNDGSKDHTINELERIALKSIFKITVVDFSRNFGKEAAMYAGLKKATGEYVAIIDADLQQHPHLLLKMIDVLNEDDGVDAVCYYHEKRREGKVISFLKSKFYKVISRMSEVDFVDGASDFRMFRHYVVDAILELQEKNRFSKGIFSWIGFKTVYLPYVADERAHGQSSFNFRKLLSYALSGILAFSTAPLLLANYLGILTCLSSFIYLIVLIIRHLCFSIIITSNDVIITLLLFIGGIIMTLLGIIGTYLAKMNTEIKNRPIFVARKIITRKGKKDV